MAYRTPTSFWCRSTGPYDITSARYAHMEDNKIAFSMKHIPFVDRETLDRHAQLLADSSVPTPVRSADAQHL